MYIIIVLLILAGLITQGVLEQNENEKNIKKIPIRVNVNGIRGKSTATRLISAVLAGAGYRNIGKTTGTSPRMIYGLSRAEKEIIRMPKGVSIGEQLSVINEAAKRRVDSLVCECMAVNPDYQDIYQNKMIKANIGVIVNVLEDHLEEMGPTMDQIAQAFETTIPYNGKLIINEGPYTEYFSRIARKRKAEVFVADESKIPEGYLDRFNYVIFPNNVAIPLAVAEAMGIDKQIALDSMLKANPDPGALVVDRINVDGKEGIIINAFAANDPNSTLEIWDVVNSKDYANDMHIKPLVVLNARGDRADRTEQFAKDCIPYINDDIDLLVMGSMVSPVTDAYAKGKLPNVDKLYNLEDKTGYEVKDKLYDLMDGRMVFLIGNVHGQGEVFLEATSEWYPEIHTENRI
ncbi:MAG: poly-gamma-glutamate synthase PgsB [Tissierellia bacterium]|nr:poly-gamma-glutamate synthase PgsB [Tissierellia bacterium]